MRYILYTRKSSESEDRQVQSIDDQLNALRECASRLGLNVVIELTEAKSAKDPGNRQVFLEMLSKIEKGEADGILCWNINRLSRNPVDSGQLSWMLQRGVLKSIRTVDREYKPEDNVLIMAVESGVANQYILDLRKAVVRGMEGKASRGWFPGRPPQGYCLNPETKEIIVKQPQFDTLRRAWDLLLTGAYTVPEVHRELSKWGYDASRPKEKGHRMFSRSHLYRIFDFPFYYGMFKFRGKLYAGKHHPMVTKAEFDRCQQIIHRDVHIQPKRQEFAFTGLIRCGGCGCMITAERKTKHYKGTGRTVVYEYYRCTRRRGICKEPSVKGAYIESAIAEKLAELTIPENIGKLILKVVDRNIEDFERADKFLATSQAEAVKETEQKLQRLLELHLSGGISLEQYDSYKVRLQNEVTKLKVEADKSKELRTAFKNAVIFGIGARSKFEKHDLKLKRQIARQLGTKYVLTLGRLCISVHPVLEQFSQLEPPKTPPDKVGTAASTSKNPLEWAWRERISTLLSGLKTEDWCFEDETLFDSLEKESNPDSAVWRLTQARKVITDRSHQGFKPPTLASEVSLRQ